MSNDPIAPSRKSRGPKGYVYFLHAPAAGRVKIGKSATPKHRVSSLQTASPEQLVLLHVAPCEDMHEAERFLHEQLARYRKHGEWFEASKEVMDVAEQWGARSHPLLTHEMRAPVPKRERPLPRAHKNVLSFTEIADAFECGSKTSLLTRIRTTSVPMPVYPEIEHWQLANLEMCADIWGKSSVQEKIDSYWRCGQAANRFCLSRAGTLYTAHMLIATTDPTERLAIFLLALNHELYGHSRGHPPETWDDQTRRFFFGCCRLAAGRLTRHEWFCSWHHLATEALPSMDWSLNEHVRPDSVDGLASLLRAHINQFIMENELVAFDPVCRTREPPAMPETTGLCSGGGVVISTP